MTRPDVVNADAQAAQSSWDAPGDGGGGGGGDGGGGGGGELPADAYDAQPMDGGGQNTSPLRNNPVATAAAAAAGAEAEILDESALVRESGGHGNGNGNGTEGVMEMARSVQQ